MPKLNTNPTAAVQDIIAEKQTSADHGPSCLWGIFDVQSCTMSCISEIDRKRGIVVLLFNTDQLHFFCASLLVLYDYNNVHENSWDYNNNNIFVNRSNFGVVMQENKGSRINQRSHFGKTPHAIQANLR